MMHIMNPRNSPWWGHGAPGDELLDDVVGALRLLHDPVQHAAGSGAGPEAAFEGDRFAPEWGWDYPSKDYPHAIPRHNPDPDPDQG